MFSTKTLCQMFFKLILRGFKLKMLVIELKMTQPVKLDEESVDRQLNRSRSGSTPSSTDRGSGRPLAQSVESAKNSLFSKTVVQPVKSRSG